MDIESNIEKIEEVNKTRFYFFSFIAIMNDGRKDIASAVIRAKDTWFFNCMEIEQALKKRISMNMITGGITGIVILNWKEIEDKEYLYFNSYSKSEFDKDLEAPEKYVFHFTLYGLV